jgi:CRP/FNR family cyclic AMP-dependent transcriptional regulator
MSAKTTAGRVVIRHKISQSDLAAMAGVARENVSQVMSNWKRNKVVSRSSGFYWLIDITSAQTHHGFASRPATNG